MSEPLLKPASFNKFLYLSGILVILFTACNNEHTHIGEKEIVERPEDINLKAEDIIHGTLKDILQNNRDISDSFSLKNASYIQHLYEQTSFQPIWSAKGEFEPWADSLFIFIDSCHQYSLFPQDYYQQKLKELKTELILDTSKENKLDAAKWAYSDLLLSSAFVQIVKDLRKGRLLPDSLLIKDSTLTPSFFSGQFQKFKQSPLSQFTLDLEPTHIEYRKLKEGLKTFLSKANFKNYTLIRTNDSVKIPLLVYQRLLEEKDSATVADSTIADSLAIVAAIKKYQKRKGIKADGKISSTLIKRLNNTDKEKFIRIAITMDKYKILQRLPEQYVWVNIPAFYLQVKDCDTVVLSSKIVVGKPETKTPIITSAITDMITYPKWHIPESIIKQEILPGLKKDPGYTLRKGYTLTDKDGNEIDPYTVTWSKYKEYIPYRVIQGSGDANALGVMKFNFPNKHSVYLHDTNQRHLFSKSGRALSHGCVRVQAWQELSEYILRNDSLFSERAIPVDSVKTWLALKEKRVVPVRKKLPLFIRYFTCEAKDETVVFYDDIYEEDRRIRETTFSDK